MFLRALTPSTCRPCQIQCVARTHQAFGDGVTPAESVVRMLADVKREGDEAVRRYAKLLDGAELDDFHISQAELDAASEQVSPELWESLELAAERIRSFHQSTIAEANGWIRRRDLESWCALWPG